MYIWESYAFFHNHNLQPTTNLRTSMLQFSNKEEDVFNSYTRLDYLYLQITNQISEDNFIGWYARSDIDLTF